MREDDMCKFFKNIRDIDIHTGKSQLYSNYTIVGGVTLSAPQGGLLEISSRGVYEVYNNRTPKEKKIQRKIDGEIFQVVIENLPNIHKGEYIIDNNPIKACVLYKEYLEALVLECKEYFMSAN